MGNGSTNQEAPTRRDYVKYGGTVLSGGLLADCTSGSPASTSTMSSTEIGMTTADQYSSASIESVSEVEFDSPPESVLSGWEFVGDILIALKHADRIVGMSRPGFWFQGFYEFLPGATMRDTSSLPNTISKGYKELLYELNPDFLVTDPNRETRLREWESLPGEEDVNVSELALRDIRAQIDARAVDIGRYTIVCARTGEPPVPVSGLQFPDRKTATWAARAAQHYRARLRRYDPRMTYHDLIVCERIACNRDRTDRTEMDPHWQRRFWAVVDRELARFRSTCEGER